MIDYLKIFERGHIVKGEEKIIVDENLRKINLRWSFKDESEGESEGIWVCMLNDVSASVYDDDSVGQPMLGVVVNDALMTTPYRSWGMIVEMGSNGKIRPYISVNTELIDKARKNHQYLYENGQVSEAPYPKEKFDKQINEGVEMKATIGKIINRGYMLREEGGIVIDDNTNNVNLKHEDGFIENGGVAILNCYVDEAYDHDPYSDTFGCEKKYGVMLSDSIPLEPNRLMGTFVEVMFDAFNSRKTPIVVITDEIKERAKKNEEYLQSRK